MRKIALTINLPEADLVALAKNELGLVPIGTVVDPAKLQLAFHQRSEAVNAAIEHVLRATRKYDEAQYSNGESSAASALFEAAKRLRNAVSEEKNARNLKGNFNV